MEEAEQSPQPNLKHPPPPSQPTSSASSLRILWSFLAILLLLTAVTALVLWLIYRPHNPHFTVIGAALYHLNTTSPPFISTSMQLAIVTRNPNRRVSVLYDGFSVYVSYRNQQLTPQVDLPPLLHETKTTVIISPFLGGGPVPVSADVMKALVMDETSVVVPLRVVLFGHLRWKAASIRTRRHGF